MNLLKKFISFSFGGYISLIIGFFTVPIITRIVSPEDFGIYSLFILVLNILSIATILGLDHGFVRYYYDFLENEKGELLDICLKIPIIIFSIVTIFILIFSKKISNFIFQKNELILIFLLIITYFISLINRYSLLLIRMEQKGKLYSFFQILNQILNFIFILVFFNRGILNFKSILYAYILSLSSLTLISIILERKIWFSFFLKKNNKIKKNEIWKYSYPFILTAALTWIFQSSDKIVIKYFSDMKELGLYAAAFKIVALLNVIQTGFTTFWLPVAYKKYTEDSEDLEFFEKIHGYISLVMFGMALVVLMSKDLIILLLGEKFRTASSIMPCLVLMPIMYTISETTVLGINFKKKTKYHMNISVVVAVLNILGNLLLVPYLGAKGAAVSTGLVYIVFFSLRTYFSLKEIKFKFNLKRFYFSTTIVTSYAIYLTFNELGKSGVFLGVLSMGIILGIYFEAIKEIFFMIQKIVKDKVVISNN